MLPFIILTIATPATITTNTIARATDSAEVYRNESGKQMIPIQLKRKEKNSISTTNISFSADRGSEYQI